ncbi:MAG: hypothetical protein NWE87_05190, partial [Candidatus Bathyarchaeota archaeon]|nr:hypothetical protein [Candidatus Bathyarchaeota archaeon]
CTFGVLNSGETMVIDPIFGYNTIGGSTENWETTAYKHVCRFELTIAGDVESISWYGEKSGGGGQFDAYGIIYDDSSGVPNALKGTSSSTTVTTTAQWYTFTFSTAVSLSAGYYWIGIISPTQEEGDYPIAYYDAGASNQEAFNADSYPPDDPFGTPSYHDHELSVYATYTAAEVQLEIEHVVNSIVNCQNYKLTTRVYRTASENYYLQMYNFTASDWKNFSTITASSLTWYNTTFAKAGFVNATDQVRIRYWQGVDVTQETLYVDYSGIYGWNATNYELDLEIQWTSVDYDEANEELCIKTGTTDAEDVKVYVWNGSWQLVFNDLNASSWNNASVTDYLTSSTFTVRFLGETETGDTNPDSWKVDATLLHVWTVGTYDYDYVLRVNNTVTDSWQIRLKKYADANVNRLQNCTIYFHNSTDGTSSQIYIQNGLYINQTGPWYDLGDSETIYIAMTAQANSTGTSYVRTYLEIRIPDTTTYAQYIITFEIT